MLEIAQKLDKLASLYQESEALQSEKQRLIEQILSPEIKARLDEIEIEFNQKADAAKSSIAALEDEIKCDTLRHGATVKASGFLAMWSQGRTLWDSRGLATYAETHGEILQFRKQGEPSVTIRRVQAKDSAG